eukprot:gene12796-17156_t
MGFKPFSHSWEDEIYLRKGRIQKTKKNKTNNGNSGNTTANRNSINFDDESFAASYKNRKQHSNQLVSDSTTTNRYKEHLRSRNMERIRKYDIITNEDQSNSFSEYPDGGPSAAIDSTNSNGNNNTNLKVKISENDSNISNMNKTDSSDESDNSNQTKKLTDYNKNLDSSSYHRNNKQLAFISSETISFLKTTNSYDNYVYKANNQNNLNEYNNNNDTTSSEEDTISYSSHPSSSLFPSPKVMSIENEDWPALQTNHNNFNRKVASHKHVQHNMMKWTHQNSYKKKLITTPHRNNDSSENDIIMNQQGTGQGMGINRSITLDSYHHDHHSSHYHDDHVTLMVSNPKDLLMSSPPLSPKRSQTIAVETPFPTTLYLSTPTKASDPQFPQSPTTPHLFSNSTPMSNHSKHPPHSRTKLSDQSQSVSRKNNNNNNNETDPVKVIKLLYSKLFLHVNKSTKAWDEADSDSDEDNDDKNDHLTQSLMYYNDNNSEHLIDINYFKSILKNNSYIHTLASENIYKPTFEWFQMMINEYCSLAVMNVSNLPMDMQNLYKLYDQNKLVQTPSKNNNYENSTISHNDMICCELMDIFINHSLSCSAKPLGMSRFLYSLISTIQFDDHRFISNKLSLLKVLYRTNHSYRHNHNNDPHCENLANNNDTRRNYKRIILEAMDYISSLRMSRCFKSSKLSFEYELDTNLTAEQGYPLDFVHDSPRDHSVLGSILDSITMISVVDSNNNSSNCNEEGSSTKQERAPFKIMDNDCLVIEFIKYIISLEVSRLIADLSSDSKNDYSDDYHNNDNMSSCHYLLSVTIRIIINIIRCYGHKLGQSSELVEQPELQSNILQAVSGTLLWIYLIDFYNNKNGNCEGVGYGYGLFDQFLNSINRHWTANCNYAQDLIYIKIFMSCIPYQQLLHHHHNYYYYDKNKNNSAQALSFPVKRRYDSIYRNLLKLIQKVKSFHFKVSSEAIQAVSNQSILRNYILPVFKSNYDINNNAMEESGASLSVSDKDHLLNYLVDILRINRLSHWHPSIQCQSKELLDHVFEVLAEQDDEEYDD